MLSAATSRPRGAVIKHSAASPELQRHEGRAVVFDSVEDMALRLDDAATGIAADDVLVLRNAGPRGAPGMPEAGYIPIPRRLARHGVKDMVRISDARMSGTAFGTVVLHVTPEAAAGGPLAIVRTGDRIRLDVPARRLELLVDEAELAARLRRPRAAAARRRARGYARLFDRHVLQADEGARLRLPAGSGGDVSAAPPRRSACRRGRLAAAAPRDAGGGLRLPFPRLPPGRAARQPARLHAAARRAGRLASDGGGDGIARGVLVQPSVYGFDNRVLLEALAADPERLRGVVVIRAETPAEEIGRLHGLGVRGVRFNLGSPGGLPLEALPRVARLVRPWGWHLQVLPRADRLRTSVALAAREGVVVVLDHLGLVRSDDAGGMAALLRLLDGGGACVKLSAPYRLADHDAKALVARLTRSHPERLLWGSDWPHTELCDAMPDDADLVDAVLDWLPGDELRRRVLVANPLALYWS